MRKNFIARNDPFTCEQCGQNIPPAKTTSRNHCPYCLTGKHVDDQTPGDRASKCHGLMPTISYEGTDPDKLDLIQQCQTCRKQHRNKIAPDDRKTSLWN